ncbi:MAG TPA: 5-formyltetrahydrofolate cyclo-ligase [Steroidobacteraceae bacterium]|nr:5-formyltetrahydrofolate cyclo-ligase [Steroidobacteraceae bacterium]
MRAGKTARRRELRGKRRALADAEHRGRSRRAAKSIARLPLFAAGARVAIYLPIDREADTALLVAAARRRGVKIFVPVVSDMRRRRLRFYPLAGRMRRGAYGILVPIGTSRAVDARWLDLIVVPVVGVDAGGCRLGMGGGFYDRALAFRSARRHWRGPRLIGLAFDCQRVASVCAQPWDLRLDMLATETGLIRFARQPQ